jgi:ice-binding like protein
LTGQDLGGLTLTPGVYFFMSSAQLTGTLTLNAEGNPNAVFIFQIGSTLTTASASDVDLINGASGANVFWQVGSSATLGTTTDLVGTIDALASVTLDTGANIACGRAIALTAAVTMDDNSVSTGGCFSPPGGSPIPESSTWAMMLVGFAGLGFAGYRQRRKFVGAASV